MVSTRRRWRLFKPWIVKPSSRVLRKLSGEVTTIQYWNERPSERPDLRFRRERPDFAGRSAAGSGPGEPGSSANDGLPIRDGIRGPERTQVLRFGQKHRQVADLGDVGHLVACDHLANLEEGDDAASRIDHGPVPLVLAPAVEQVDRPAANSCKVLERLVQRAVELMVVGGVDGGAHVGRGETVQVGVPEESIHLRARLDEMPDQTAERRERSRASSRPYTRSAIRSGTELMSSTASPGESSSSRSTGQR